MNGQFTFEGCLPACLMNDSAIAVTKKKELELILHSLKFNKFDYTIGNIDLFSKKYKKNVTMIVENKAFCNFLKSVNKNKRIGILSGKISICLIDKYLEKGSAIVYIDDHYLGAYSHNPHFVTVFKKKRNRYCISDPWDGKNKLVKASSMSNAMRGLSKNSGFSPKLIQVVR